MVSRNQLSLERIACSEKGRGRQHSHRMPAQAHTQAPGASRLTLAVRSSDECSHLRPYSPAYM